MGVLGVVWISKSGLGISFRAPEVPFSVPPKRQKWPHSGTKKWHFGCPNKNSETTFISPTSPKNDGIAFGFKCLPLLDGFLIHSEIWYFFDHFRAVLPLARTSIQNGGAIDEI